MVWVVESKRNAIRQGFVQRLLNAQDMVLCSYFAQRYDTKGDGCGQKSTVEEGFQGLDRFELDLVENSEEERGQEDYTWKAQASKLEGWSRKRGLGSGNPSPQRGGASGEAHYEPPCRIDLEGPSVWQTLGAW